MIECRAWIHLLEFSKRGTRQKRQQALANPETSSLLQLCFNTHQASHLLASAATLAGLVWAASRISARVSSTPNRCARLPCASSSGSTAST